MAISVRNNLASVYSHNELLNHNRNLDNVLKQTASGLRLNHPSEDAAKFVFSEQLRTKVAGATQALKNNDIAISMIQTADSGLEQITRLLVGMKKVLIHASNDSLQDNLSRQANQSELDNAILELDLVFSNLRFGKRPLYKHFSGANGKTDSAKLEFLAAGEDTVSTGVDGYEVKLTSLPSRSSISTIRKLNDEEIEDGNLKFTFLMPNQKLEYTTIPGQTPEQIVSELNGMFDSQQANIYVSMDNKQILNFQSRDFGSRHNFQIITNNAKLFNKSANTGELLLNSTLGRDAEGSIAGEIFTADGLIIKGKQNGKTDGLSLKLNFSEEIKSGTILSKTGQPINEDEDYSLLEAELPQALGRVYVDNQSLTYHIGDEYQQLVKFHLPETNSKTLGLGVDNKSGIKSLNQVNVKDFDNAQDSLLVLDRSIGEITKLRGRIGAFQKNLLEPNQNSIAEKIEELTNADSQIRDADIAKTTADIVKYQLSQSVATDVLKSSNARASEVLRLFRS